MKFAGKDQSQKRQVSTLLLTFTSHHVWKTKTEKNLSVLTATGVHFFPYKVALHTRLPPPADVSSSATAKTTNPHWKTYTLWTYSLALSLFLSISLARARRQPVWYAKIYFPIPYVQRCFYFSSCPTHQERIISRCCLFRICLGGTFLLAIIRFRVTLLFGCTCPVQNQPGGFYWSYNQNLTPRSWGRKEQRKSACSLLSINSMNSVETRRRSRRRRCSM